MQDPADRINALIRASQLYYGHELNQSQVAEVMRVHRTEVSRMLNEAKRLGIVQVTVDATFGTVTESSRYLEERFGLHTALIIPDPPELNYVQRLTKVGKYADSFLHSIIRSNTHIGVSWGLSLAVAADCFQHVLFPKNVTVLPLIGGPRGIVSAPYQANGVVYRLASRITGGVPYSLDTPAIVRSEGCGRNWSATRTWPGWSTCGPAFRSPSSASAARGPPERVPGASSTRGPPSRKGSVRAPSAIFWRIRSIAVVRRWKFPTSMSLESTWNNSATFRDELR